MTGGDEDRTGGDAGGQNGVDTRGADTRGPEEAEAGNPKDRESEGEDKPGGFPPPQDDYGPGRFDKDE